MPEKFNNNEWLANLHFLIGSDFGSWKGLIALIEQKVSAAECRGYERGRKDGEASEKMSSGIRESKLF